MFELHGDDIYISRGEAATLTVQPVDGEGVRHAMAEGETLVLRLSRCGGTVMTLTSADGVFALTAADTAGLSGRYDYTVTLRYADGARAVIVGPGINSVPRFTVLEA